MQAVEILAAFRKLGITAYINGNKLVVEAGSKLPPELVPEIRQHKSELMDLLAGMCFCKPPMSIARSARSAALPGGAWPVVGVVGVPLNLNGMTTRSRNTGGGFNHES
jgi:hypothetical protein